MNLALYRKYRPQTFSEVLGQEHVIKTLTTAIAKERISHAYLFSGPRGSGKTTVARLFAKAINCLERKKGEFEPCNKCLACREIIEGRSLDLIEIDAASHRGIDEIKELKEGVKFFPTRLKYKVFIFDEAHQLSKDAANALLKTLEEPPERVIFILATTEIHKMIPTILSRCQRFDFRKLSFFDILKKLQFICQKEKVNLDKKILELIALSCGGALRDAESILEKVITFASTLEKEIELEDVKELLGFVETESLIKFVDFLLEKNPVSAINFLNEIGEKGIDFQQFTKSLINYLRQILIFKIVEGKESFANPLFSTLTKEQMKKLSLQAKNVSQAELSRIINLFLDAQNKMRYSPIAQLPLELAIVEICYKKS